MPNHGQVLKLSLVPVPDAVRTSQHVPEVVEDCIAFLRRINTLPTVGPPERLQLVLATLFSFFLCMAGNVDAVVGD